MPIYPCLLCLSSLDKDNRPLPAKKVTIKAQIVRLYDLLVPQHRTSSPHQSIIAEIEDTDGFKLCQNCFLSAKEIEKIKQQVSQLEEKIVKKVQELRKTVSNSFQKDETIGESLQKVRKSLLSPDEETEQILPDFEIKLEDESCLMNNHEEQFPPQNDIPCPPSPTPSNHSDDKEDPLLCSEDKDDPLFSLNEGDELTDSGDDDHTTSDDDSDFCITPDNDETTGNQSVSKSDQEDPPYSPPKPKRSKNDDKSRYKYSCGVCLSKFRRARLLRLHLRTEHQGFCQFQCQVCQNKYESQGLLDSHMIVRHETEEKSFFCTKSECGKGFTLELNFLSHMRRHKVDKSKIVVCSVCDVRFVNQAYLDKHASVHATWKCDFCEITLGTKNSWQRHVRTHTGEKPVKCDQCEESFIDKRTRRKHVIRRHTTVQHLCSLCGKGFPFKYSLKLHVQKVHENLKRYECSECGEKFQTGSSLKAHTIREHNADPFVCDECGDTFTGTEGLKSHKVLHSGIKKHQCHICGAGFYLKKALTQHLVSHSDVRNHICHACGGRFKAKKNLDRHLTRVHKLDVEKTREVGGLRKKRQMQPEVVRSERPKSKC
ncbi:zinc finger protein 782 [Folsomia candida]|uniref:zinc finger protein 782 n=1 Tax=Folsomia candida TaxID=158441 RepID=UPI0016054CB5|nr:zinc finger protein 782 [Folsomia candida]